MFVPSDTSQIGYYHGKNTWFAKAYHPLKSVVGNFNLELVWKRPVNLMARYEGRDWPLEAETMIGIKRLDNIEYCIRQILADSIPGDFIEAGVWRGGAAIFMKGVLEALKDTKRIIWLADSFAACTGGSSERSNEHSSPSPWIEILCLLRCLNEAVYRVRLGTGRSAFADHDQARSTNG